MPSFGTTSRRRLDTIDGRLVKVLEAAIEVYDFSVLCGHRNKKDQDAAYNSRRSKVQWPNSKHNTLPSLAVDIAPYPVRWPSLPKNPTSADAARYEKDMGRFRFLAGLVVGIGASMGYSIRWGGDWDRDGDWDDQSFNDLPHFEVR